ncbi:alanine racemase [Fulvivirga lutea]|uniref:Alanine racemase n=1 Tax=Fulvivirga lutea TaxID=2810512 RepID=A0A975A2E2_9BACT|nr:alanine racemase [Fulvivirga lutea]QSE99384.1 alanine racemase [Fulvivirga lutea]
MEGPSSLFLSFSALQNNINFVRSRVGKKVIISSVVKGNAYGHGIKEFVQLALKCGIKHFSVFSSDEAYEVVDATNGEAQIMIMGEIPHEHLEWAISNNVEFFVFECTRVTEAINEAKRLKSVAKIHIEVETGLNRTGFNESEIAKLIPILHDNQEHIHVKGICTHFAGAESVANHVRIQKQIKRFNKHYKYLLSKGIEPELKHTACSAAAMVYPKTCMDMVRIGILQYGFWPSKETFIDYVSKVKTPDRNDPLKRVISWKSSVMSVKYVTTGEFIGYGTSFLAQQDMKIAAVPVGYSHGYSRVLSNLGRALVNGIRVGVIGLVNMNMMMLDITEVEEVEVGDEVILIGGYNGLEISVASFGELSNQLNYELLTRLPQRIPRKIIE